MSADVLKIMIEKSCIDGKISQQEYQHLQRKAKELQISDDDLNFLINCELEKYTKTKELEDSAEGFVEHSKFENNTPQPPTLSKTIPAWLESKITEYATNGIISANEWKMLEMEAENNKIDFAVVKMLANIELEKAVEQIEQRKRNEQNDNQNNEKTWNNHDNTTNKPKRSAGFWIKLALPLLFVIIILFNFRNIKEFYREHFAKTFGGNPPMELYVVTVNDNLVLRKKPNDQSDKLGSFPMGTKILVFDSMEGWYRVKVNGNKGYMNQQFVKEEKEYLKALKSEMGL